MTRYGLKKYCFTGCESCFYYACPLKNLTEMHHNLEFSNYFVSVLPFAEKTIFYAFM